MSFIVSVRRREELAIEPVVITSHPNCSGLPMTLDEAREVLRALILGAVRGNSIGRKALRRLDQQAQRAVAPPATIQVGPVKICLMQLLEARQ